MRYKKPPYILPFKTKLFEKEGNPPFVFENVTCRVFPIKANMARLTRFCSDYLNMDINPEIVHFRPAIPYVYLMVLNYGSMSPQTVNAQNLGWVAQREVTFTVPLERWQMENGRLVFKNWACVSPWIFVDEELSLTTGREVYGWPKAYATMETAPTLWCQDPRLDSRIFMMKTNITPRLYAGEREQELVLMEIDLAPRPTYSEFPPSPNNPWSPVSIMSTAAQGSLRLFEDFTDLLAGLPIRGYRSDRSPETLLRMMGKAGETLMELFPSWMWPLLCRGELQHPEGIPEAVIDQITLKQFNDAERPEKACYQALVTSPMGINRLNAFGMLGDLHLLRGDPSGGFTIRLHRYAAQPIVECLGLEIEGEEGTEHSYGWGSKSSAAKENGNRSGSKDPPIAVLKPTFPFWSDVDLYYGKGSCLCSRTSFPGQSFISREMRGWIDERNKQAQSRTETVFRARETPNGEHLPNYNTLQGAAVQPVTGPFRFPDITLQVYPLLADREMLSAFLDRYVNIPLKTTGQQLITIEPFSSYVYMIITVCDRQYGTMWSETNNIGWWADKDVSFCVPVKVYQGNGKDRKLISLAMVCPFAYGNSSRAVITDREVNGRPSAKADIKSPPDAWLGARGPDTDREMVVVETEVFPALNLGQRGETRVLVKLSARDAADTNEETLWRLIMENWAERKIQESVRLDAELINENTRERYAEAEALALEILAPGRPVNFIYLKQYRDAANPEQVCYQAYVNVLRSVHAIYEIREITDPVFVRLHKYPSHPIRETFGLECKRMDSDGEGVIYVLEPRRPFWMRLQLNEDPSQVICSRNNVDGTWIKSKHPWVNGPPGQKWDGKRQRSEPYFRSEFGESAVGPGLLKRIDTLEEPELKGLADTWLREALNADLDAMGVTKSKLTKPGPRQRLSAETHDELDNFNWDAKRVANLMSTDNLYWFVEELRYALEIRTANGAETHRRYTRQEARNCIAELDDVQALVEKFLNEGWLQ